MWSGSTSRHGIGVRLRCCCAGGCAVFGALCIGRRGSAASHRCCCVWAVCLYKGHLAVIVLQRSVVIRECGDRARDTTDGIHGMFVAGYARLFAARQRYTVGIEKDGTAALV